MTGGTSDIVFLDSNVLFSAAYHPSSDLRQLWSLTGLVLLASIYAIVEVRRSRPNVSSADLSALLQTVSVVPTPPAIAYPLPSGIVLPTKDALIFRAAAAAEASHLLTGDERHFGACFGQVIGGVLIVPPATYLKSRS